jgi:pilus assembly protein CpaF
MEQVNFGEVCPDLASLFSDPRVLRITVLGYKTILVERADPEMIQVGPSGVSFSSEQALVEAYSRLTTVIANQNPEQQLHFPSMTASIGDWQVVVVCPPLSSQFSMFFARRLTLESFTLQRLIAINSISEEMVQTLRAALNEGRPMIISGPTRSGKTTFLGAILREPQFAQRWNVFIDEQRDSTPPEGDNWLILTPNSEVSAKTLVRIAAASSPNAIIIDENHGPGTFNLIDMMSYSGGIFMTLQASSASSAVRRLEALGRSELPPEDIGLRTLLHQSLSASEALVIHLDRLANGRRIVREMVQILDADNNANAFRIRPLFSLVSTLDKNDLNSETQWLKHKEDEVRTL